MSEGAVLLLLYDPSHRVWNDCQLALQDAGLWYWCVVTVILMNVDQGPYRSAAWWGDLKAAVHEYVTIAKGRCSLFSGLFPNIEQEMHVRDSSIDVNMEAAFETPRIC